MNINSNFYHNICKPLFIRNKLLSKAIELFYDPNKFEEIKDCFHINSDNIISILFGYRYILNELSSENQNGIYYSIYKKSNFNYLKEKLYPGNDTEYNREFSKIVEHFKTNESCYICLCKKYSYHVFLKSEEKDMKCPKCGKKKFVWIFKDDKEIESLIKDKYKRNSIEKLDFLTFEEFKEKYINTSQRKEKGLFITDKNSFKNDNKIIRNLSQISYRLLNYILYTHLFFARLITNKKEFKYYLPKGMNFTETLYNCWIILKNELLKVEIYSIEKFMNYIFVDLFPILNKKECINDYDSLIKFEDELEIHIQESIKKYKKEGDNLNLNKKNEDSTSFVNLLKENFTSSEYDKKEFPFYEFFYYTDYLNEEYINEKLNHMDENKYPVLKKYIEYNIYSDKTKKKNDYSSDNLILFNKVLNLFIEKYSDHITRIEAEKKILKYEEIYINNKELIDSFIEFYNKLFIEDPENRKLSNENYIIDFFITDSKFGITYKKIYKKFIEEQNNNIEDLLENKIQNGIFNENCKNKINIQNIKEADIFNYKILKHISFIDILFYSSYREILDSKNRNYESYKEYKINYDLIEENLTDLLLKNKKLLNDDITEFIFNDEIFNNEIEDSITLFRKKYNCKNIDKNDKEAIYKFYNNNKNFTQIYKDIINDFMIFIKILNDKRKEDNNKINDIKEESKIYSIINKFKDVISDNFIKLFEDKDGLTIDKTAEIFEYFLKSIYKDVENEIKIYQEELNEDSKERIKSYYRQNSPLINKKDFAHAIRLFVTIVLFPEEDKEKKIVYNHNNILNCLKAPDFWNEDLFDNPNFYLDLNELKSFNVKINQIISLYMLLGGDIDDDYFEDDLENKSLYKDESSSSGCHLGCDDSLDNEYDY